MTKFGFCCSHWVGGPKVGAKFNDKVIPVVMPGRCEGRVAFHYCPGSLSEVAVLFSIFQVWLLHQEMLGKS